MMSYQIDNHEILQSDRKELLCCEDNEPNLNPAREGEKHTHNVVNHSRECSSGLLVGTITTGTKKQVKSTRFMFVDDLFSFWENPMDVSS